MLALVGVALVGVIGRELAQPREPEPVYQGKSLSEWLKPKKVGSRLVVFGNPSQDMVVRQIGTNAIPTLLRMLRAKDSAMKTTLIHLAQRQHIVAIEYTTAHEWNQTARHGFQVLGAEAQSAVPALTEIVNHNPTGESKLDAIAVLGLIGPPATEALLQCATNADAKVRSSAIWTLLQIDPDAAAKAGIK